MNQLVWYEISTTVHNNSDRIDEGRTAWIRVKVYIHEERKEETNDKKIESE